MAATPLSLPGIRQKVHSENAIIVWEDLWLQTVPARPARPTSPVVHPMISINEIIIGNPKR